MLPAARTRAAVRRTGCGRQLFYDASHCAKVASHVNYFFLEIMPSLKCGVTIHSHDIFPPKEYLADWVFDRGQTWNEQYVLQAFFMNNPRYQILIPNRFLYRRCADMLYGFSDAFNRRMAPVSGSKKCELPPMMTRCSYGAGRS